MTPISRNQMCPCNSGKRYKHCCGAEDQAATPVTVQSVKTQALARQRAVDLISAEKLYRQALEMQPDEPDCLHMLGVVFLQTRRIREASEMILRAAEVTRWQVPAVRHNLTLALGALLSERGEDKTYRTQLAYRIWCGRREREKRPVQPLVSVVIPSYCHAAFVVECLESVYRQTWPHLELIVIDDGSRDDSVALIRESLKSCPFPHSFIARANRGAHATINEGIALAKGEYINILNSDDRFAPDRIARMVDSVAAIGAAWGFAGVDIIDATGQKATPAPGSMAEDLSDIVSRTRAAPTVGFDLMRANTAISTGNLFLGKAFLTRIGGMSDLRYNHDWEFVLRATLQSEPVYVPHRLYQYRVHGSNTILESSAAARAEADAILGAHIGKLLTSESEPNPFAPTYANWGMALPSHVMEFGLGSCLPLEAIQDLARLAIAEAARPSRAEPPPMLARLPGFAPVLSLLDTLDYGDEPTATFDQWQRYGIAAKAIDRLRREGEAFSILEVGASTHRLLGKLLPQDRITFLDLDVPAEMHGASDVIVGDATRLEMPDGSFDIVVALDVFEHVDVARRRDFLFHTTRVARRLAVIAAPFGDASVVRAEQDAVAYWNSLFAQAYRWLAEHADNGLPVHAETLATLKELGVASCGFGHGHLDLWRELMKAHFAAEACGPLRPTMAAIDRFYRARLLDGDAGGGGHYRQFLLCSRSPEELAPLQPLCAEMAGRGPLDGQLALFELLDAVQRIAQEEVTRRQQSGASLQPSSAK